MVMVRAICAALALAALPVSAAAQSAEAQTRAYLEAGLARHAELGYARDRTIEDLVRPLTLDGAYLWSVYMRAGVNYRVYAACDNDCSDVDMEIYGVDGALVDRDVAPDDTPYVQITPTASGRAYVRLWIYQCEVEPCYVAARVVSGGRLTEREDWRQTSGGADYEAVVRSELEDAGATLVSQGYAQFGVDVIEPIVSESDGYRYVVQLDAGRAYLFQGACDQDCSDVDMEIVDPRGQQVDEDLAPDDRPVVRVRPQRSGEHVVRIWLAECSNEPCYVGVRGFARER